MIFSVGRPDFGASAIDHIHGRGLKAGIFIDKNFKNNASLEKFDRVIPIDFEDLDAELAALKNLRGSVAGLLCTYENYLIAKAKLGAFFNVPVPTIDAAARSTDKILMRSAFLKHDPAITPKFQEIASEQEALDFATGSNFPVITKPASLVKSLFVSRADTPSELEHNVAATFRDIERFYTSQHIYERSPRVLVEEYMAGQQYSVAAYVDANGKAHFCPGITRLVTANERGADDTYLYQRELPAQIPSHDEQEFYRVAQTGIAALGLTASPAHVELMKTKNGTKIIEIGARTGGYRPRMYDIAYGIDLIEAEIAIALGEKPLLAGDAKKHVAVFELFPKITGAFREISSATDELKAQCRYFKITPAAGSKVGPAKEGFRASAVIIVEDTDEARFRAKIHMINQLSVEVE